MSRTKTEINPKRAENIKKLIEGEKITQTELADRIHMTQQNISRIVQMKQPLTEETARLIIEAFPEYRIEWLLGYDDFMTKEDLYNDILHKAKEEATLLHSGLFSLAKLSGFKVDVASLSDTESAEKALHDIKEYCTISREEKSVSFSINELNSFENEICDYIELRLRYMMK